MTTILPEDTPDWAWSEPLINFLPPLTTFPDPPIEFPQHSPGDFSPPPSTPPSLPPQATGWQTITTPYPVYVSSSGNLQKIDYSVSTSDMASLAHSYMENEAVWIIPRQNKLTFNCKLEGNLAALLKGNATILVGIEGILGGVTSLFFSIDAIRMLDGNVTNERAPLFIQNTQKMMTVPEKIQIFPKDNPDWAASWSKLQFSTTTSGNSNKVGPSERFHLVVSLIAQIQQGENTLALTINSFRSPPLMVIGQNPARFMRSKMKQQTANLENVKSTSSLSPQSEDIPPFKRKRSEQEDSSSINNLANIFNMEEGKVGINCKPYETLSVGGNIFYTGDLIKPSDRRIKRNIQLLNGKNLEHMQNISRIKLYQYERMDLSSSVPQYIPERGVIAQEVKQILPSAVASLGPAMLPDGTVVDLLAVNHQDLLIETIGATQNLNDKTDDLSEKVESLSEKTQHHASLIENLGKMVTYIQNSERQEIQPRFSILGLGPAWTACIMGFFFPLLFLVGALYMCSKLWTRQIAGIASLLMFTAHMFELILFGLQYPNAPGVFVYIFLGWWGLGVFICCIIVLCIFVKKRREQP